jgi:hypothetical protein
MELLPGVSAEFVGSSGVRQSAAIISWLQDCCVAKTNGAASQSQLVAPKVRSNVHLLRSLLYLVFAFGAWGRVFDSLLRFGFFHGSLGFGSALGAGFATFLALFIEDLFAPKQFDESVIGTVAFSPSGADDAQVAAIAIAEAGTDGIE